MQFSTFTDIVSSLYHLGRLGDNNVIAWLQKLVSGNTGMEKIDGISDDDYHTRGGYDSPYKGHEVDTWISYFRGLGINVNVIGGN